MSTYLKYDKFVLNTRALLKSHNMLNKDLAAEINTTEATISRYLTGKREPEVEYIYRIATYFDVSIDWLIGVQTDKHDTIHPEAKRIAELYSLASDDDKAVVNTLLRKYEMK